MNKISSNIVLCLFINFPWHKKFHFSSLHPLVVCPESFQYARLSDFIAKRPPMMMTMRAKFYCITFHDFWGLAMSFSNSTFSVFLFGCWRRCVMQWLRFTKRQQGAAGRTRQNRSAILLLCAVHGIENVFALHFRMSNRCHYLSVACR